jgi:hypothetical protein
VRPRQKVAHVFGLPQGEPAAARGYDKLLHRKAGYRHPAQLEAVQPPQPPPDGGGEAP